MSLLFGHRKGYGIFYVIQSRLMTNYYFPPAFDNLGFENEGSGRFEIFPKHDAFLIASALKFNDFPLWI